MNQQVVLGHSVAERHHFGVEAPQADSLVAILAEDHRLAVLEQQHPILAHLAVREIAKRTIVEDVAVLEDLDEGRAPMTASQLEGSLQVLGVCVHRACDEAGLRREGDRQRHDGRVDRPGGRRLRALPQLGGWRRLTLGQPVDPVVEHDHLEIHVPAHRMQDVVSADRQRVAVARDHPTHQVWPGGLEAGRERRRATVDGVEAERVHVVGQAPRAADPADEDDVLARVPEVGHHLLGLGKDRVIAATRAPAHLLVGHEVLPRELDDRLVLGAEARLRGLSVRLSHRRSFAWLFARANACALAPHGRERSIPVSSARGVVPLRRRSRQFGRAFHAPGRSPPHRSGSVRGSASAAGRG